MSELQKQQIFATYTGMILRKSKIQGLIIVLSDYLTSSYCYTSDVRSTKTTNICHICTAAEKLNSSQRNKPWHNQ